jgi:hypothetical protein
MRVNRSLLYVGLFLVGIGAIVVAADGGLITTDALTNVVRAWPVAVIAIGASLVLRRTRASLAGGMLAAAMPGLLLGSAFAVVPRFAGNCGATADPAFTATERGSFDGSFAPSISLSTGCGSLDVHTAPGRDWLFEAGNSLGNLPDVESSAETLAIQPRGQRGWGLVMGGRDRWALTVPQMPIHELSIRANANEARINLAGALMGQLDIGANASDVTVDATESTFEDLSISVNAGSMSLRLPSGAEFTGDMRVNAGSLEVCFPPEIGLRIETHENAGGITLAGQEFGSGGWESDNYGSATYHADVRIRVNFGSVAINPIGGCR